MIGRCKRLVCHFSGTLKVWNLRWSTISSLTSHLSSSHVPSLETSLRKTSKSFRSTKTARALPTRRQIFRPTTTTKSIRSTTTTTTTTVWQSKARQATGRRWEKLRLRVTSLLTANARSSSSARRTWGEKKWNYLRTLPRWETLTRGRRRLKWEVGAVGPFTRSRTLTATRRTSWPVSSKVSATWTTSSGRFRPSRCQTNVESINILRINFRIIKLDNFIINLPI